jgi:hypothetical protein
VALNTFSTPVAPRHFVTEYAAHDIRERPHQARGNQPPATAGPPGGMFKHYRRAA